MSARVVARALHSTGRFALSVAGIPSTELTCRSLSITANTTKTG